MGFDQTVLRIVDLSKVGQFGKITAHQRQVVFFVQTSDVANMINAFFITNQAAKGVAGVGGVNNNPALTDDVYRLTNKSRAWGLTA